MSPKLLPLIFFAFSIQAHSQSTVDSVLVKINPEKWSSSLERKLNKLEDRIISNTEKTLRKLEKQEAKLHRQLPSIDSLGNPVTDVEQKYQQLSDKLKSADQVSTKLGGEYLPYLDSLNGALSFLNRGNILLSTTANGQLGNALNEVKQFEAKLQQADAIKQYIRERREQLMSMFTQYSSLPGPVKQLLSNYNKEIFYYSEQIREYKEMFRDPDKLLAKSLSILDKLPAFQKFMKENSMLGALFQLPANYGTSAALTGLQTRSQVQQLITNQFSGGNTSASQMFSQQIQAAQSQLNQFKQKLDALGGGSGDIDMPDFKPNMQRTKTFFQRLEYGTNIQSTKSNLLFPMTTDLAFTLGYKIDDKKTIGLGIGGKIGWGKDIHHVGISGQGMSLRSFMDIKIKKSFYASGGFEYNYQKPFTHVQLLYDINEWSKSGLIGVTKSVSIKSKVFKKTKIQLLWDFLSYYQMPRTQPVKFRVGYDF